MVAGPIVLLIAVTTAPDGVALMNEAAAACVQTLPPGATTVVRQVSRLPDDTEVGVDAATIGAAVSVIVTWRDDARLVSDVRVLVPSASERPAHTTVRTIVFSVRDLPSERGRALGLIIASILDEARGTGAQPLPEATDPKFAAVAVASIDPEVPAAIGPLGGGPAPAPLHWVLEASVVTAVDRDEDFDDTIGGMIALRRSLRPHWAARVGLGLRVVDLDGADASARSTLAEIGLVWSSDGFARPAGFGFGARIDLLGAHETIRRSGGDEREFEAVWSAGADVLGQVGFGLSAGTTLLLSAGAEAVLTDVRLVAPDQPTVEVPWDRLILELGVLSRF